MNDNKKTKLSIIIPVYNAERYIHQCLESIFMQGLDDSVFEVIMVDDGTMDNSFGIISDILTSHSNIIVYTQKHLGPSIARKNGILKAHGEYLLFVDSDDLLVENVLPSLLQSAIEQSVDLLVGNYLRLDSAEIEKRQYGRLNEELLVKKSGFELYFEDLDPRQSYIWRSLYKRSFIINNNLSFAMDGFCFEDIPFVHECYLRAKNCLKTNQIVCVYRVGHVSITSSMNKAKLKDLNNSICRLWNLQYSLELPTAIIDKLRDNVFSALSFELWCISHSKTLFEDYEVLLDDLKNRIPDLSFKKGCKQRFVSYMFWRHPYIYLKIWSFLVFDYCALK